MLPRACVCVLGRAPMYATRVFATRRVHRSEGMIKHTPLVLVKTCRNVAPFDARFAGNIFESNFRYPVTGVADGVYNIRAILEILHLRVTRARTGKFSPPRIYIIIGGNGFDLSR